MLCPGEPRATVLLQTAKDLAADNVAVLLTEGGRLELVYPNPARFTVCAEQEQFLGRSGAAIAGSPLAQFLSGTLGLEGNAFLLHAGRVQDCLVASVFGFAQTPQHPALPDELAHRLDLVASAIWSARQLDRLHSELKVVHQKLARRKLVEQAKALLQARHQLDEPQAYELLRRTSRQRRVKIESLAEELLRAQVSAPRAPCTKA